MKIVILCGGLGTRLREETEYRPKPMVEIGGKPILWHIMKNYAHFGFEEFILCLGYKGRIIKDFFYNYEVVNNDFTVELGSDNKIEIHRKHDELGWRITLAETGEKAMTGSRVSKVARYIDSDDFMLTYGDGLADIDLQELERFHASHGKIGTVTGVIPPSRFGSLDIEGRQVTRFSEKPRIEDDFVSGGFFIFKREFLDYLSDEDDCILEKGPLDRLAADGELVAFLHEGFWQCMDTYRDYQFLNEMWNSQNYPWKMWD